MMPNDFPPDAFFHNGRQYEYKDTEVRVLRQSCASPGEPASSECDVSEVLSQHSAEVGLGCDQSAAEGAAPAAG